MNYKRQFLSYTDYCQTICDICGTQDILQKMISFITDYEVVIIQTLIVQIFPETKVLPVHNAAPLSNAVRSGSITRLSSSEHVLISL